MAPEESGGKRRNETDSCRGDCGKFFSDPPWGSAKQQEEGVAERREVVQVFVFEVFLPDWGHRRYPKLGSSQGVQQECYPTKQAAVGQALLPSYLSRLSPLYVPVLCNQTQHLDSS